MTCVPHPRTKISRKWVFFHLRDWVHAGTNRLPKITETLAVDPQNSYAMYPAGGPFYSSPATSHGRFAQRWA
jgi:hypothetical protein